MYPMDIMGCKSMSLIFCKCGCGQEFEERDTRGRIRKYIHGHSKHNIGRHHSEEILRLFSKQRSGILNSNYGKRGLLSSGNKNRIYRTTPIHKNIRNIQEMINWRNQIFHRDNFICQLCDKRGGDLEAHHIKKFIIIIKENNITSIETTISYNEL